MTTSTTTAETADWPQFTRDVLRTGAVPTSRTRGASGPRWLTPALVLVAVLLLISTWGSVSAWTTAALAVASGLGIIELVGSEVETYQVPAGSGAARIIDSHTGRWPRAAVDAVLEGKGLQKVERIVEQTQPQRRSTTLTGLAARRVLGHARTPAEPTVRRTGTVATGVTPRKDGDLDLHLRLGPGVSHAQLDAIAEQLARALHVRRVDGLATTGISSGETTLRFTMREAPAVPESLDDEWE